MLLSEIGCRFTAVVDPKASPLILERITYHGGNLVLVDVRDSHGGFLLSRSRKSAGGSPKIRSSATTSTRFWRTPRSIETPLLGNW